MSSLAGGPALNRTRGAMSIHARPSYDDLHSEQARPSSSHPALGEGGTQHDNASQPDSSPLAQRCAARSETRAPDARRRPSDAQSTAKRRHETQSGAQAMRSPQRNAGTRHRAAPKRCAARSETPARSCRGPRWAETRNKPLKRSDEIPPANVDRWPAMRGTARRGTLRSEVKEEPRRRPAGDTSGEESPGESCPHERAAQGPTNGRPTRPRTEPQA